MSHELEKIATALGFAPSTEDECSGDPAVCDCSFHENGRRAEATHRYRDAGRGNGDVVEYIEPRRMPPMLRAIRCSALPLAFRCGGSVRQGESELALDEAHELGDVGTCAHEGLAVLVEVGSIDWHGVTELVRRHGVEEHEADVRYLLAQGARLWESPLPSNPDMLVKDAFPGARTEVAFSEEIPYVIHLITRLTGHVDIISRTDAWAHIADWKTGYKDSDYSEQLRGYCALVLIAYPELELVTASVLWVRDMAVEQYTMRRSDLAAWAEQLVRKVVAWDGVYRPSNHCVHCRRSHDCPAGQALVRRAVAFISEGIVDRIEQDANILATMTHDEIVDVLGMADVARVAGERLRAAVRHYRIGTGVDIIGSGKRLTLETTDNREVDYARALPILDAAGFTNDDKARCIKISASKAEKVAASKVPKGKGAGAVRLLQARLADANAIHIETTTKLVTKRHAT